MHKIGIIVGKGSGRILAEAFITYLKQVGEKKHGQKFEFYVNAKSPVELSETQKEGGLWYRLPTKLEIAEFSTYTDGDHSKKGINDEIKGIVDLLNVWKKAGIKYIFRTSINADILYALRKKVKAVKVINSNFNQNKILIIRDEFQGFYANDSWEYNDNEKKIEGKLHFSKANFETLIDISNKKAKTYFKKNSFLKFAIYKHHLFDGYIEKWIKDKDTEYKLLQPDTGNSEFLNTLINKTGENILVLASNEYGDVIHEYLLNLEGKLMYKIALFTKNYYLKYPKFIVYQTVHGSADDKKTENILPIATLRIAADILYEILQNSEIKENTDRDSRKVLIKALSSNQSIEEYKNFDLYKITHQIINYGK